jgi:hypothetical protein
MATSRRRTGPPETVTNGTAARLCTAQKNPNTDPTPGAHYRKDFDLAKALQDQSNYACNQFNTGQGVVGPNGSESGPLYAGFNGTQNSQYETNQLFASQHDLQATDADGQHSTGKREEAYKAANVSSAVAGMWVLKTGGTVEEALQRTKEVFHERGFEVKANYGSLPPAQ